jgi:hypothetical protein
VAIPHVEAVALADTSSVRATAGVHLLPTDADWV